MSKNKEKKGSYQGIEHLRPEITGAENSKDVRFKPETGYHYLRGDLITVLILILVFFGVLVGLTVLDKNTVYLDQLAEKLISFSQ